MNMRTLFVCLLVAVPALGSTAGISIVDANVKTADASRGLRTAVSAAGTEWVAWTIPTSGKRTICCGWRDGGCCGGCTLDGRGSSITDDRASGNTAEALVAVRLRNGRLDRARMFDARCTIDGNGAAVTLLSGVTAEASIDFLASEIDATRDDDAMWVLAQHEHPRAVATLIALARKSESTKIRRSALFWLGQRAGEKAAAELRHAVDHDPQDEVRQHAVFAISQLPAEQAVPMLIDLVKTHKSRGVREKAMFWLSQTDDPRALALMEEILTR